MRRSNVSAKGIPHRLTKSFVKRNWSNFLRKIFFTSFCHRAPPPACVTSQCLFLTEVPRGKFDSAIIVFPDRTVGGERLTELWLSLSSHHCHATLNSGPSNKKATIFTLTRRVFLKISRDYCQGNR